MDLRTIIKSVQQDGMRVAGRKAYQYATVGTPQDWTRHLDIEAGDVVVDAGAHRGQLLKPLRKRQVRAGW